MSKPNNPPAFPTPSPFGSEGMTLRDWFAGQALAGLMANTAYLDAISGAEFKEKASKSCYNLADAMLAEREA